MELLMSDVSVKQRGRQILSDVSVIIKPGINIIAGESGAGKTAMLRSIAGLQKYEGGIFRNKCGYAKMVYQPYLFSSQKKARSFETGKCRRLGISQVFEDECEMLILDEPMVEMNPEEKEAFRNRLLAKKESDSEKLILISVKDVTELESICDHVIFLHKGKVLDYGTKDALYEKYQVNSLEEVFSQLKNV